MTQTNTRKPLFSQYMRANMNRWLFCLLIAGILISICSRSSPFYPLNNAADANIFFSTGKAMMHKTVLYRDIYEQKGPLLYLLFGIAYLFSNTSFAGVFVLEVIAYAVFLRALQCILSLYLEKTDYAPVAAIGAVIAASSSFVCGSCSVEEFSLPFVAWSLYFLLKFCRVRTELTNRAIVLNGFLCGCLFWMKYTLLGFFIGWVLVLIVLSIRADGIKLAAKRVLWFGVGFLIAAVPWMIYFAANHAIADLWLAYFYNNMFRYSNRAQGWLISMWLGIWRSVKNNLWYFILIGVGIAGMFFCRPAKVKPAERGGVLIPLVLLAVTTHIGGQVQAYSPLIIGVFAVFGVIPLIHALKHIGVVRLPTWSRVLFSGALIVLCVGFAYKTSYNTFFFGADRSVMPQYDFAETMHARSADPTLLNYGFMDGGFYTVSGIVPNVKYYTRLNVLREEIAAAQNAYLTEGAVEFVVTENTPLDITRFANYALIDKKVFHSKSYESVFYLYQKKQGE